MKRKASNTFLEKGNFEKHFASSILSYLSKRNSLKYHGIRQEIIFFWDSLKCCDEFLSCFCHKYAKEKFQSLLNFSEVLRHIVTQNLMTMVAI